MSIFDPYSSTTLTVEENFDPTDGKPKEPGASASNHRTEGKRKRPSLVRVIKSVAFCMFVAPVMLVVLFIGEVFLWIVEARE